MNITGLIGETTEYEKKVGLEEKKPKSWCKTVSAFANGEGGAIIWGVDDQDNIVGLLNPQKASEIVSEQIKSRLDPIPDFSLEIQNIEDKPIVIANIKSGVETPYYYIGDGNRVAYHRVGNQSVPAEAQKLKELVLRGSDKSYDSIISKYDFSDYAFTKLKATYKQRAGKTFSDSDFESFGLVNETGKLTNAGALLADESPIRHSRLFCTRWNGLTKASGVMEALDDKEFSGSLIILLQNGIDFITIHTKKKWKKTATGRIEMPDYPERSYMEGLVNGLIHRQYLELGSEVHIDMFDDRLEIYSPGGMVDGTLIQDGNVWNIASKRRNPIVADMFERLNYMERRGSGFKKIMEDYENQTLYSEKKKPTFYSSHSTFILTLPKLNYEKTAIKTDDKKPTNKINMQQKQILEYMEVGKEYRLEELSHIIEVKTTQTKARLKTLIEQGDIEAIGSNRNRRYKLSE